MQVGVSMVAILLTFSSLTVTLSHTFISTDFPVVSGTSFVFVFIFTVVPPLLTTDSCSWGVCAQETLAKALITLDRGYFTDLFAMFKPDFVNFGDDLTQ